MLVLASFIRLLVIPIQLLLFIKGIGMAIVGTVRISYLLLTMRDKSKAFAREMRKIRKQHWLNARESWFAVWSFEFE